MNSEDLKRFRDYANHYQGSDVAMLMEHIDTRAVILKHRDEAATYWHKQYIENYNDPGKKDKQIATLKAALIDKQTSRLWNDAARLGIAYEYDKAKAMALAQLAQEMPEIFGADVDE
jgi:hypothetical protein